MHLCTENPCPIQDIECLKFLENGYKTTYTMTPLEQFNEEMMKEFEDKFPKLDYPLHIINCRCPLEPNDAAKNIIQDKKEVIDFITKKLTEHKELILKMVREKVPMIYRGGGKYCFECEDYIDGGNSCMCLEFNRRNQEFLNNLDTI